MIILTTPNLAYPTLNWTHNITFLCHLHAYGHIPRHFRRSVEVLSTGSILTVRWALSAQTGVWRGRRLFPLFVPVPYYGSLLLLCHQRSQSVQALSDVYNVLPVKPHILAILFYPVSFSHRLPSDFASSVTAMSSLGRDLFTSTMDDRV